MLFGIAVTYMMSGIIFRLAYAFRRRSAAPPPTPPQEVPQSLMSHSAKKSNLFTVALVGAAALKGKEVRDVLSERSFPAVDIKLLDEEDALGQLDQVNDEPAFIQGVLPEHLEGVDFAFLTADESFIAKVWASVRDSGSEIIDLSYALENNTDVVLRAPWVENANWDTPTKLRCSPRRS